MRAGAVIAFLLPLLLFLAPLRAEEPKHTAPPPAQSESCSACTGSLVKSWRIRKGDPKSPPPSRQSGKSLERQGKEAGSPDFAD